MNGVRPVSMMDYLCSSECHFRARAFQGVDDSVKCYYSHRRVPYSCFRAGIYLTIVSRVLFLEIISSQGSLPAGKLSIKKNFLYEMYKPHPYIIHQMGSYGLLMQFKLSFP